MTNLQIRTGSAGVLLFFGAVAKIDPKLHKAVHKRGGHLGIVGLNEQPKSLIERSGLAAQLHT